MSEENRTMAIAHERPLPLPSVETTGASQNPPASAPTAAPMGPLELAAYRADWRASLRYRKHIGEVAAAREHELLVRKLEEEARLAAQKAMRAAGKKPTATSAEGRKTLSAADR
jgi:hypothetical protein